MAGWLRYVTADLLHNGYRRIDEHHFEDALLRAYRSLELIGQFRLFDKGYDSSAIPPDDPLVVKFREELKKKKSGDFGAQNKKGGGEVLTASKMLTARFLKRLDDPFGEKLIAFDDEQPEINAGARNLSILIHGFTVADLDECSLRDLYDGITKLLEEDCPKHSISPGKFGAIP